MPNKTTKEGKEGGEVIGDGCGRNGESEGSVGKGRYVIEWQGRDFEVKERMIGRHVRGEVC